MVNLMCVGDVPPPQNCVWALDWRIKFLGRWYKCGFSVRCPSGWWIVATHDERQAVVFKDGDPYPKEWRMVGLSKVASHGKKCHKCQWRQHLSLLMVVGYEWQWLYKLAHSNGPTPNKNQNQYFPNGADSLLIHLTFLISGAYCFAYSLSIVALGISRDACDVRSIQPKAVDAEVPGAMSPFQTWDSNRLCDFSKRSTLNISKPNIPQYHVPILRIWNSGSITITDNS